jgi:hypothetical protein
LIDSPRLLDDLTTLLGKLEADLRAQFDAREDVRTRLQEEYDAARRVGRTVVTFEAWAEEPVTQAAVAWILGTVFVRFFEDNGLVEPRLSGVGPRHTRAVQEHQHYFQQRPTYSDRDYLEHVFRAVGELPAAAALFDPKHNPLWRLPLSADGARLLVAFWQRIDPDLGRVSHDFTDPDLDTRFLGDLYQDLSEPVRRRYALLQTPRFVERFILDRTLTPAIEIFGYREVRLIDPACGSGHFLLGAFERLLSLAQHHEPGRDVRVLVRDTLARIVGVDVNPYAVAIARMRLAVAALQACGITRLAEAPAFELNVVVADALLHGPRFSSDGAVQMSVLPDDPANQYYFAEDEPAAQRLLGQRYNAVVGNPPYITVKDRALNALYRQRYPRTCHMKYSLVAPFVERCFELAIPARLVGRPFRAAVAAAADADADDAAGLKPRPTGDSGTDAVAAGFVGLIVANSFMKREFGSKLIEGFLPAVDLTHLVDTSGAYIPGHGTPTVILFGRNRKPSPVTRTVMGIRGEPSTPEDPSRGLVWSAILDQIDRVASESAFVSVRDLEQASLHSHPWSIGGGGAAELKELLDERGEKTLGEVADSIGITSFTLEDDLYLLPRAAALRHRLPAQHLRPMVVGDVIRDWSISGELDDAVFAYDEDFAVLPRLSGPLLRFLWLARTVIGGNKMFGGKTKVEVGLQWWEWGRLTADKLRTPLSITFAFVATHNHFVLDRGGKVFKQSAPVIKLPPDATEDNHLALLGLLNSSTACFWMKQVFYPKATASGDISTEKGRPEANRYEFAGTGLEPFPLPAPPADERLSGVKAIVRAIEAQTRELDVIAPGEMIRPAVASSLEASAIRERLAESGRRTTELKRRLVVLQEELDWEVYRLYGLVRDGACPDVLAALELGCDEQGRPFRWDTVSDSDQLSEPLRSLYRRRHALIAATAELRSIETPVFKRLWLGRQGVYGSASRTYEEGCDDALRDWLLDRLEDPRYWPSPELTTSGRLADDARRDEEFMRAAEVFRGCQDFDVTALVTELVEKEGVPYLPALRYTESGLRKRAQWERTWDLQRMEDAIDARMELPDADPLHLPKGRAAQLKEEQVGAIPVPPKYTSADFKKQDWWRLRGKLDVPKERFVLYPGAERAVAPTPVIAWAGWDRAQQARALGAYYMRLKSEEGSASPKLVPLLAGLLELLPWVKQWHAGIDPEFGEDLGAYYAGFIDGEARGLGLTVDQVRAWVPEAGGGAARRRAPRGQRPRG